MSNHTTDIEAGAREMGSLIDYLREQHDLHLRAAIPFVPSLAARVAREYGARDPRLVKVRDQTVALRRLLEAHLDEEEDELFPAIRDGRVPAAGELRAVRAEHRQIGATLDRLRLLTDRYRAPSWACPCYRTLLEWLDALEHNLVEEVRLEDRVLRELAQPAQ